MTSVMLSNTFSYFFSFLEKNLFFLYKILLFQNLSLEIQLPRGRIWISLTGWTPQHIYACLNPGPGFPIPDVVVFWVVICVDIGGIVDHHWLNFLVINKFLIFGKTCRKRTCPKTRNKCTLTNLQSLN